MGAAIFSCCAMNIFECAACAACSCFTALLNWTMSQAARFSHILIILLTFTFAIIIGTSYPDQINGYNYYTEIDLTSNCDTNYINSCIYRQLIYRASFSLVVLFSIMVVASSSNNINKGYWIIKFGMAFGLFIAFWWGGNTFFTGWAEIARVLSFFWLLIQALLLFDFAHDIHEVLLQIAEDEAKAGNDARGMYLIYLSTAIGSLVSVGVGLAYLFKSYAGCSLGMFFILLTLIIGVITTILSMLESINRGLLTPCIMFAYSVFLCWYALLSSPTSSCNPFSNDVGGSIHNSAIIIISIISIVVMMYCVFNGTKILNIFNPNGEGVMKSNYSSHDVSGSPEATSAMEINRDATNPDAEVDGNTTSSRNQDTIDDSGTAHERVFFHVLMVLVVSYGAMVLTNWGSPNGGPNSDNTRIANESMWLIIVSQWLFMLLYFKALQVAYSDNQNDT